MAAMPRSRTRGGTRRVRARARTFPRHNHLCLQHARLQKRQRPLAVAHGGIARMRARIAPCAPANAARTPLRTNPFLHWLDSSLDLCAPPHLARASVVRARPSTLLNCLSLCQNVGMVYVEQRRTPDHDERPHAYRTRISDGAPALGVLDRA